MLVICVSNVADRYHGYLRSVMLNVHPGVFVAMDLDAGSRDRVFDTIEEWFAAEPTGSIVLIWKNPNEPLAIEIRNLGVPKREVIQYDDVLGVLRRSSDEDKLMNENL
jgi:CRISPR-associated protein Cas2